MDGSRLVIEFTMPGIDALAARLGNSDSLFFLHAADAASAISIVDWRERKPKKKRIDGPLIQP
jgi:hypothetical protein